MKTKGMWKSINVLVIAVAFAACAISSTSVPAMANEIVNGGFDSGAISWLTGTSQHNMVGGTVDGQTALEAGASTLQKNEFQYIDAKLLSDGSANPGWIAGASSETYTFSFQYDIKGTPSANTDVILYSYNPTTAGGPPRSGSSYQYAPGSTLNPLSSFTQLYNSGQLSATSGWVTVNVPTGTITGPNPDPEWFAVYIDAKDSNNYAAFDSFSLVTQSKALTPEPSAMVSIVLGMAGLATYGRRRVVKSEA